VLKIACHQAKICFEARYIYKYIYIYINWEEHIITPRKLPKIGKERLKYIKLRNLTAYFQLLKILLAKKVQFWKGKFKIVCLRTQLKFFKV